MKYEELLHFLINDILKYGFLQSNNFEKFLSIFYNIHIPSGLILNLENEFFQDNDSKQIIEKNKKK